MRPHGRQGAGADRAVHPHADRRAPRGRRPATCRPLLVARTDAAARHAADQRRRPERDQPFLTGERTAEGFFRVHGGARGRDRPRPRLRALRRPASGARPPHPTSTRRAAFAEAIHAELPGQAAGVQLLALVQLEEAPRRRDHRRASSASWARMGYKFQFVTLAGFHALNHSMFDLARGYARRRHERLRRAAGARSSPRRRTGYTATRHQREVGAGYFDRAATAASAGESSTLALRGIDRGGPVRRGRERGLTTAAA